MKLFAPAAVIVAVLSPLIVPTTNAQGCASTCPPLDDTGKAIPSLCVNSTVPATYLAKSHSICHPLPADVPSTPPDFKLDDYADSIVVLANHYIGCNAGRRESGVFAHVAQRYHDMLNAAPESDANERKKIIFVTSLKGGSACERWADMYQSDGVRLYPDSEVTPREMPWTVSDVDYRLRDDYFTTPFGHPSYVVLAPSRLGGAVDDEGGALVVRNKFVGPCCGFVRYSDCQPDTARELDAMLSDAIDAILLAMEEDAEEPAAADGEGMVEPPPTTTIPTTTTTEPATSETATVIDESCIVGQFSEWSPCSIDCGPTEGTQFRWRSVVDNRPALATEAAVTDEGEALVGPEQQNRREACPSPVEVRSCSPADEESVLQPSSVDGTTTSSAVDARSSLCVPVCIPEFGGSKPKIVEVATGFDSPRDVAFHPTPGLHLGDRSEGRDFNPAVGEEAWVANGANHSISIVAALGSEAHQTTISRRDRGYYHYLVNVTALSFNVVPPSVSGRDAAKDSFAYFSVCNDNNNDYMGSKEENYFMGPTLYDTDPDPAKGNLVNRLGEPCNSAEQCTFLHADMLHESPSCIGIAHDPEVDTAYGTVYWAFDSTGDRKDGQLVRFDFQQPHGPGSMDHSVAAIRRYPEVKLHKAEDGVHAGMVVHPTRREIFISNPGDGTILAVDADSGTYARTAREEYPIYSNRLPSFEYSVWECVNQRVFAKGLDKPTGLALSPDGNRLFVAERGTGKIHVHDVESGALVGTIDTGYTSINGMSFSPDTNILHFVDDSSNSLVAVKPRGACSTQYQTRLTEGYEQALTAATLALGEDFSITKNFTCVANPIPPNASLFDQVHVGTGYASDDPNVQAMAGMDAAAALLANRTDCGLESDLNFDALLLGGYYCHQCLPINNGSMCDTGGICRNVQWRGFVCDNEFIVRVDPVTGDISLYEPDGTEPISFEDITLRIGVTYRFTIVDDNLVSVHASEDRSEPALSLPGNACGCAKNGPLLLTIDDSTPGPVYLRSKVYLRSNVASSSVIGIKVEQSSDATMEMQMKDTEALTSGTDSDEMITADDTGASAAVMPELLRLTTVVASLTALLLSLGD
mmetsp:Transcript_26644/g.59196  ORF Transcript_26644/g.59196 Transcript_26644/m.59196 type:complete len:1094 (-) Transcript_26644:98-3379(-)